MPERIHIIANSVSRSATYLITDKESELCVIVDCGDVQPILNYITTNEISICAILLTHAHFDHIYGLNELMETFPYVMIYTNEAGQEMLQDEKKNLSKYHESTFVFAYPEKIVTVKDGEEVKLCSGLTAKAEFTSGHNPSCVTWVIEDMVFTGDSLIPGFKTVTNLPGGNKTLAACSEKKIKQLAKGKIIYPGHQV